eukprot:8564962-Pyramimonas_sp.AAC.1
MQSGLLRLRLADWSILRIYPCVLRPIGSLDGPVGGPGGLHPAHELAGFVQGGPHGVRQGGTPPLPAGRATLQVALRVLLHPTPNF